MSFEVRPAALRTLSRAMDDLDAASDTAAVYSANAQPPASGFSAMVRFLNSSADVRPACESFFEHLASITAASADELVAAATTYEELDAASSERLDARYPKD
ncbi:MAG: hypothetical protein ABIQ61_05710 [Ornithinibacter sp.]